MLSLSEPPARSGGGGGDAEEEYLPCDMHPLLASFGFGAITDGETSVSNLIVPLTDFHATKAKGKATLASWQRWNWRKTT
jgi:hypothetical protein